MNSSTLKKRGSWVAVKTKYPGQPPKLWLPARTVGCAFRENGKWFVCTGKVWDPRELLEVAAQPPWAENAV